MFEYIYNIYILVFKLHISLKKEEKNVNMLAISDQTVGQIGWYCLRKPMCYRGKHRLNEEK